jgi:two-component system KDP operon response regulator KdpE
MSRQTSILIVDGDPMSARLVRSHLQKVGYHARSLATGDAALDLIAEAPPDLVILDPMLPSMDGYTLCEEISAIFHVPVIMLAASGEQEEKLRGFAMGADDYILKPYSPPELIARVGAVLRRVPHAFPPAGPATLRCGPLSIDVARRRVTMGGETVRLTPTEFRLLLHLTRNAGKVLSHAQLLTEIRGPEYREDREYLWVYIRQLRRKLDPGPGQPTLIRNEPGFGYVLDCTPIAA